MYFCIRRGVYEVLKEYKMRAEGVLIVSFLLVRFVTDFGECQRQGGKVL